MTPESLNEIKQSSIEIKEPTIREMPSPEHTTPHPPAPPKSSGRGRFMWLLVIVLLGAGAYFYWSRNGSPQDTQAANKAADQKSNSNVVPVVATRAKRGNIGVYLTGLGAVTPIYTDTIKTRVDGELISVLYHEGDLVQKGQLLMEVDPRPYQAQLDQYQGQLVRDQAILDNAKVDLTRYQTLLEQNAIPEQQLATQKALVVQSEGVVKADQGMIDSAKLNLVYCKITAPIAGRVGLRLVDPGNIVHATDTNGLVVITQVQPISVIFTIPEDQLPDVRKRMLAGQTLHVDGFNRDMTQKIAQGTLTTLDNVIDQTTGTLRLRATFDNKDDALFPSQFVNVRLLVQQKQNVVLVSTAGIQRSGTNTYVFVVKPDSTVTIRNVTIGTTEGDESEITSGLDAGDTVVLTGVDKLIEGTAVRVQFKDEKAKDKQGGTS